MHLWVHRQGKFEVVEHYGGASKMSCRSPGDLPITFRMIKTNEKKFEKMFFLLHLSFIFCVNCVVIAQRWIQTTSTYANAEVTFSVVKLSKLSYPFSPPNYCLLFFCRSKRLESLRPRVCRGYSAEAVERLCMPAMR